MREREETGKAGMKLGYYLRGLGLGILVASLVLGIALGGEKEKLTDEEIRTRALQLGMMDSTVLSNRKGRGAETTSAAETEIPQGTEPSQEMETLPEGAREEMSGSTQGTDLESGAEETLPEPGEGNRPGTMNRSQMTGNGAETAADSSQAADGSSKAEEVSQAGMRSGTIVRITIRQGDSSVSVSKTLAEAGLVENAEAYDRYLCANGYDHKIRTGTFEVPAGSREEAIAKIITGETG
ncbi:MAG: endolytic transglycosylase MltG [Clostridium sp.]|jgi:hypothetical protein|nr:endolytic transglycosylase MltG [Clostridium sp.]